MLVVPDESHGFVNTEAMRVVGAVEQMVTSPHSVEKTYWAVMSERSTPDRGNGGVRPSRHVRGAGWRLPFNYAATAVADSMFAGYIDAQPPSGLKLTPDHAILSPALLLVG